MARRSKKAAAKPAPKASDNNDDFDDLADDDLDSDGDEIDVEEPPVATVKSRDWRDVERLKEERRLRSLIEDDLDL